MTANSAAATHPAHILIEACPTSAAITARPLVIKYGGNAMESDELKTASPATSC